MFCLFTHEIKVLSGSRKDVEKPYPWPNLSDPYQDNTNQITDKSHEFCKLAVRWVGGNVGFKSFLSGLFWWLSDKSLGPLQRKGAIAVFDLLFESFFAIVFLTLASYF